MTFNHKLIVRIACTIASLEGIAMLPSLFLALYDCDYRVAKGIAVAAALLVAAGQIGLHFTRTSRMKIKSRESYFIVLVCWLTAICAGLLPFLFSGEGYGLIDCFFESVSSWTTSMSHVLDADRMPRALVLWKATSSWLGGMGVILLALLLLRSLGVSGQKMAGAELPGPTLVKTTARMSDTARLTYEIYAGFSLAEYVLLRFGGLPFFSALVNTMTSISTCGFIDYHGVAAYQFTPYIRVVIALFSIIGATNFILYINLFFGQARRVFQDYELRLYLITIAACAFVIGIALKIHFPDKGLITSFIDAFAGVVSYATTSGFPLERVYNWPALCKTILLLLMIVGGCSGSTAGGIKVIRAAVFIKLMNRGMYRRIHPQAVKPVMIRKKPLSSENATNIASYILLFLAIYLAGVVALSLENFDMETTLAAPIALLTNTGCGFGAVWNGDFSIFSGAGKLVCALLLILGRLEIYAVLILFSRSFWNSDRAAA